MYSTCIFCHSNLGANEAIEHFPVGRRLAFDAAKGRLWVVCRTCERWNLSPLEERWEAIEECERMFADTRLRVSTDNIGLARIREGLELVRIGTPRRPEMAAWRYGDQFGRRRRKHLLLMGAGVAAATSVVILGPMTGVIAGSTWGLWNLANIAHSAYQQRRIRARLMIPGFEKPVAIRLRQLNRVGIVPSSEGWALRVPFEAPSGMTLGGRGAGSTGSGVFETETEYSVHMTGSDALRAAGQLLPSINSSGAKRPEVESAVRLISSVAEPAALFAKLADPGGNARLIAPVVTGYPQTLANLPREVRLALEMAAHEESERRALEGELAVLETAWRQAEEIAAIADDMLVPDETRAKLAMLKGGGG